MERGTAGRTSHACDFVANVACLMDQEVSLTCQVVGSGQSMEGPSCQPTQAAGVCSGADGGDLNGRGAGWLGGLQGSSMGSWAARCSRCHDGHPSE